MDFLFCIVRVILTLCWKGHFLLYLHSFTLSNAKPWGMVSFDSTQIPCGYGLTNLRHKVTALQVAPDSGYGKETVQHILTSLNTFTLFQVPRRRLKAQFMSGVFAHLDVAQAVRFVGSHTVASSISPGRRKYFIQSWPSLKSEPRKSTVFDYCICYTWCRYDGLAQIKWNYECAYAD